MSKSGNSVGSVVVLRLHSVRSQARPSPCSTRRPPVKKPVDGSPRKPKKGRDRAQSAAREGREFLERQRDNLTSTVERGRQAFEQGRQAYDQARKETL